MNASEPREDAVARDNAISNSGDPHMRLLIAMKYGPTVHGEACKDPAFKARHDAAIDAAIAALAQQGAEPVAWISQDALAALNKCRDDDHNGCVDAWMRPTETYCIPLAPATGAPR